MALSSPPRAESQSNPWARLDAQLVALLGDLYYHGYDSFLCSDIDNNKVLNTCCEYRCEYGNVDSVPVRPQPPPREALMACRAAIKPERYPSAFDWAAAFHHAAWSCLADREAEAPLLRGFGRRDPQEDLLAGPSIHKSGYASWAGRALIEHTPTHWGCILADRTAPIDQRPNRSSADKYFLRSELLACVSLLRLRINETLWNVWEQEFTGWKLRVGDSPVKSTVVCFEDTRVRVIQASYDPSSPTPSLVFTVQGSYTLAAGPAPPCSKEATWAILWWILNPDGPSDSLTGPIQEERNERQPRPRKKEQRVPSPNGSATSAESQPSSEGSLSSLPANVDVSG